MTAPNYPGYPAAAPKPRPATVTVAAYLLYAVAAAEVVSAIMTFAIYRPLVDALKAATAGTEGGEQVASIVAGFSMMGAVVNLILAAVFATLGVLNARGKNPARIITWVVGGLSLCCSGAGLGGNQTFRSMQNTGDGAAAQAEIERQIGESLPSWYTPTATALSVLLLLAMLAVIILLALPASNDFFRKPVAGFDPNVPFPGQAPGVGYPGAQYPQYPEGQYPGGQPPGYGQQPYAAPPAFPASPSPYGQPGQPAPGLPPYPGQASPPPAADPYAPPPAAPPVAPPPPPAAPPVAPPPAAPPAAEPFTPPAPPSGGDEPRGDEPPRPERPA